MGCFTACFRLSKKRNRRRLGSSKFSGQHRLVSYEPLQSPALAKFETADQPICSQSDNQNKAKVRSSLKIRKKVSFNLNVVSYEPDPDNEIECHLLEDYGDAKGKRKLENARQSSLQSEGGSTKSALGSYPSNYRYGNCYQDEDKMLYDDSDDYDYSDDEDEDFDDVDTADDDDGTKETSDGASLKEVDKHCANKLDPFHPSTIPKPTVAESNRNVRGRSQYAHPVLNPVENVSQWKVVKAKTSQLMHRRKENMTPEQEQAVPFSSKLGLDILPSKFSENFNQNNLIAQDVAVDASFSHWLPSARVPKPMS